VQKKWQKGHKEKKKSREGFRNDSWGTYVLQKEKKTKKSERGTRKGLRKEETVKKPTVRKFTEKGRPGVQKKGEKFKVEDQRGAAAALRRRLFQNKKEREEQRRLDGDGGKVIC